MESQIESLIETNQRLSEENRVQQLELLKLKNEAMARPSGTNEQVEKLLSISTWVFNNFGSKEFLANLVVPTGESNVKMVRLSENYPDMIRIAVKNQLVALSKHEKTSTKTIIRDLIKSIFTDPRELGDCNAEILMKNFPIIEACRGKPTIYYFVIDLKLIVCNHLRFHGKYTP